MEEWQKDRVGSAENGTNPTIICKVKSGYIAIGDVQFLKGYCVLLASPEVSSLDDLELSKRSEFLTDMAILGEAIQMTFGAKRMNYSILGNTDAFLHAHVFPRYNTEDKERIKYPVWLYPFENWKNKDNFYTKIISDEELNLLKDNLEYLKGKYYY